MCRVCEVGSLELFDSGGKTSCTTFLILWYNSCQILNLSGVLVVRLVSHLFRSVILGSG